MELINLQDDQVYRNGTSFKLSVFAGIILLVLVFRLYYIQIHQYNLHQRLSDENRIKLRIIEPPRGLVFDRNLNILAKNRPSYQVSLLSQELKDKSLVISNLMKTADSTGNSVFDSTHISNQIQRGVWRRFRPQVILEDASPEVVAIVEEHQLDLPGVVTVIESRRHYPFGALAGHALGYTTEISEKEFDEYKEKGYRLQNRVGVEGLEKKYESLFRGKEGKKFIEVNVYGKELRVLGNMPNTEAVPGKNIVTTLDLDLQKVAEASVPDSIKGAVVAIDPRNGEILVMLSSPRLDGNIFSLSKRQRSKEWAKLALDSDRPLNNRATIGLYEPGSTFKAVVSLAGFRTGQLPASYRGFKSCRGGYKFGNRTWKCWKTSGHGSCDFFKAFRESCDTYYYQVGLLIGMDNINEVAREFGFGRITGLDLMAERSGLLMDSAVYNARFKTRGWRWTRGQVLNLSIGQGQLVTPLQLANYAAGLGNGRKIYRPHLLKEIRNINGETLMRYEPAILNHLKITPEDHKNILEGMRQVVEEPGGTGSRARVKGVVVGGKSGSAENPHGALTHGLFIAVAPLYNPEIAIAVILENIGHGGSVAAPIAGNILKQYFLRSAIGKTRKKS